MIFAESVIGVNDFRRNKAVFTKNVEKTPKTIPISLRTVGGELSERRGERDGERMSKEFKLYNKAVENKEVKTRHEVWEKR